MYPEVLEAEGLWGDDFAELLPPLYVLQNELHTTLQDYLKVQNPSTGKDLKMDYQRNMPEMRQIIYGSYGDKDAFNTKLEESTKVMLTI